MNIKHIIKILTFATFQQTDALLIFRMLISHLFTISSNESEIF